MLKVASGHRTGVNEGVVLVSHRDPSRVEGPRHLELAKRSIES
jgi:hypothetical protein